jgi:hypothetical protein
VPGGLDGVGDYALGLAKNLRDEFGYATVFATFDTLSKSAVHSFEVVPLNPAQNEIGRFDHVLLHYVNYGYQKRGVPFGLLSILRRVRRQHPVALITIFHELYASGPPWSSAFWLRPLQVHLTKSIARHSGECIVASENFSRELQRLAPNARIHLHPTPSGLGEPSLSREQIKNRDPRRWVVVGGTVLAERSLRSFGRILHRIPDSIAPRSLFVLGGDENPATRSLLVDLGIEADYRPRIAAGDASEILETCSFAWFDYFHRGGVETSVILKSSAFAAACAHGVIPVLPHCGSLISIGDDCLPGPFFVNDNASHLPDENDRPKTAADFYQWYCRNGSLKTLCDQVAAALAGGA